MSTFNAGYRPQGGGGYGGGRGGGRRNNDNRGYRSHLPGQASLLPHVPRQAAPNVQGQLPLHPPLLMRPGGGPNTRAPTIFPQHVGVVPQPITIQQNLAMAAAAAGLPPQFYAIHAPQQAQFATNQPINLGMTGGTAQIGTVNPPQQITTGMHGMPPSGMMTPSVNTVTSSQVPGLNANSQPFRPSARSQPPPPKRQSKAIKIIDPSTHKEVNVAEGGKSDVQQPSVADSLPASTATPLPATTAVTTSVTVSTAGSNVAQDFKRMVQERNTSTGAAVQGSAPVTQKRPLPNAIITDPNKQSSGVANKTSGETSDSKQPSATVEDSTQDQQQRDVPPVSATVAPPTLEPAQVLRDEFKQKVKEAADAPPTVTGDAPPTLTGEEKEEEEVATKISNSKQESAAVANVAVAVESTSTEVEPATDAEPAATVGTTTTDEKEAKVDDSKTVPTSKEIKEEDKTEISERDTSSAAISSESVSKSDFDQTPAVEAHTTEVSPTNDKQVVDVVQEVSKATPPDAPDARDDETPQQLSQMEERDSKEVRESEPAKQEQRAEEEKPSVPVESKRKEEEPVKPVSEPPPQVERKEDTEIKSEPSESKETEKVSSSVEVDKATPTEPVPTEPKEPEHVERSDEERTDKPQNEATVEPQPVVEEEHKQLPSNDAEIKEIEQPTQPPKPVKQDEPPPATKVANQDKPVDKDRTSPPAVTTAKPKEAVKQAEPVKPEKKDKAAHRPANVPATARPVCPAEPQSSLGRTMYERAFLLSFKEVCTDVPPELQKFDVFQSEAYKEHRPLPPVRDRDYRDYQREFSGRDYNQPRKGGRRDRDPRRGSGYQSVNKEPVDLHKAENRWVRQTQVAPTEDGEMEELFRKFQAILNKLTPQKFKNLAEQALNLKIDSEQRLKGCIDKIFTKALEEPKFSIAYANLCKVMSTIKVDVATEEGKPKVVTFRRVLLTKCQQEFEKDKKDDEDREKMLAAIKDTEDADKKKQLEDELFVLETKNRKRSLGNIRFIGELFKLQMLSETIMHECIVRLLRSSSDEESLECFAGLITTTGKDLDKPEAKARIDSYFNRIAEIIKKGKVPARIKFMLQDVQELRGNSWVPRVRQEQSLKTIDQIHHEAKVEEEKEKQFVAQAMAGSMKHGGGGRDNRRGSLKPDDWQGGKGDRDRDRRDKDRDREREKPKEKLDARRLQVLLKHREKSKDSGPPTLGPATFRPQGWGRGGAGGGTAVQDTVKSEKDSKRPSRTSSSTTKRSDKDKLPVGRGSSSGPKRSHSTPTPDSQAEKALAIQAVLQATSKGQAKSQPPVAAGGKAEQQRPVQDKMDEATVRRKTTTIIDELVENKDFKEAIECVQEMKSPGKMNFLVSEAINHSLEKSSAHRQYSGRLFSKLISTRHIAEAKFIEGLNEVLEFAEDMAIDIPKIWDYLGEILSPVVSESALSLSFLSSVVPSLISPGKAGVLAAKILVCCRSKLTSDEEVTSLWTSSSLEWSTLGVPSDELGEFLSRHGLAYLQGSSQPSSDSQPLEYVKELSQKFGAIDVTNDDIFDWIESNCPPPVRSTPEFVTTVTTAIVNATVTGEGSSAQFREESFKKRAISIKKYVDENKDLQLRVLYALQIAVAHLQHPPGMLNNMFNAIYDLEIVGEDMFRKWRDKGTEQFGKGAAVLTVKSFFEWLDSCETESDDET